MRSKAMPIWGPSPRSGDRRASLCSVGVLATELGMGQQKKKRRSPRYLAAGGCLPYNAMPERLTRN